jgi:hypothetical protein
MWAYFRSKITVFSRKERRHVLLWQVRENMSMIFCILATMPRVVRCSDSQNTSHNILGAGILFEFGCTSALQNW